MKMVNETKTNHGNHTLNITQCSFVFCFFICSSQKAQAIQINYNATKSYNEHIKAAAHKKQPHLHFMFDICNVLAILTLIGQ